MKLRLHTRISDSPISSVYVTHAGGYQEAVQELKNIAPGSREYESVHTRIETYNRLNHAALPKCKQLKAYDGKLYLFWQFVHGSDLQIILPKVRSLTIEVVIRLCVEICDAIDYLHTCEHGPVIHGNLCLANIYLNSTGKVRILGWSRYLTQTYSRKLALTGYEAPEQATNDVSPATDVYSVGKILQTMLGGVRFPDQATANSQLPIINQLNDLVAGATEPSPEKRLNSVSSFQQSLADIRAQVEGLNAHPL